MPHLSERHSDYWGWYFDLGLGSSYGGGGTLSYEVSCKFRHEQ